MYGLHALESKIMTSVNDFIKVKKTCKVGLNYITDGCQTRPVTIRFQSDSNLGKRFT